ncbi:MAG: peptidoglycan DD-metalloendopeptidase family protein [Brachymonas sp.]|nr:peptidoglycan DD-metalloendopeptidase family protein [Brachymonas sp.]
MIHPDPTTLRMRAARYVTLATMTSVLAACGFTGGSAPVVNRSLGSGVPVQRVDPATLPGYEFTGKPGYYTVQQGDTVRSISRALNIDWRDLAQWNNTWVPNPDVIEIGQVLRVVPPAGAVASVPSTTPPVAGTTPSRTPTPSTTPAAAEPANLGVALAWPTKSTTVIAPFDDVKNKGIGIAGKEGDPIYASADGRVMYAGSGLRGYGNLIILKHNDTLLTVYAHNSRLLVKEGQSVKKGQHIANMGKTDADRVKLHFEVRRGGKTVNPLLYLPRG